MEIQSAIWRPFRFARNALSRLQAARHIVKSHVAPTKWQGDSPGIQVVTTVHFTHRFTKGALWYTKFAEQFLRDHFIAPLICKVLGVFSGSEICPWWMSFKWDKKTGFVNTNLTLTHRALVTTPSITILDYSDISTLYTCHYMYINSCYNGTYVPSKMDHHP